MSHWTERAACRGMTEIMFPARGDTFGVELAKSICASCPVIDDCLAWVVENPQRYGVWAGIAGKEISQERKRRGIKRPEAAHGSRSRYIAGCRCEPCTDANRRYQTPATYVAL